MLINIFQNYTIATFQTIGINSQNFLSTLRKKSVFLLKKRDFPK